MSIKKIKSAVQYHIVKSFMCPKCFSIESIQADLYYERNREDLKPIDISFKVLCDKCESTEGKTKMIEIDPSIVVYISRINKAGFETSCSCEGHYKEFDIMEANVVCILPYVSFNFNNNQQDKKQKLLDVLNNILELNPIYKDYIFIKENKINRSEVPEDGDRYDEWEVIIYGTWYDVNGNNVLEKSVEGNYIPKITRDNYFYGKEIFINFLSDICPFYESTL